MSIPGHRGQNPFLSGGGGGNSRMGYSSTGAHKKSWEGLQMLSLGLSHLNLCLFIKPFKDGQIISWATAVMAHGISPTQWGFKCCNGSCGGKL